MSLIGLAHTNPKVTILFIDPQLFRAYLYKEKDDIALFLFLRSEGKKPVILVSSIKDLAKVMKKADEISCECNYLLFEDLEILQRIIGINILDSTGSVTVTQLNEALQLPTPEVSITEALEYEAQLSKPLTFEEIIDNVISSVSEEIKAVVRPSILDYATGKITKRMWVNRVRKPLLATGLLTTDQLLELEKAADYTRSGE